LWDTGAGTAISLEAGCTVVDLEGKELSYNPSEGLKQYGFIVYPNKLQPIVNKHIISGEKSS
jgi:3'-phosphoadenosine 5'-phosphosulfate (PAPS) 3'-phosphatase